MSFCKCLCISQYSWPAMHTIRPAHARNYIPYQGPQMRAIVIRHAATRRSGFRHFANVCAFCSIHGQQCTRSAQHMCATTSHTRGHKCAPLSLDMLPRVAHQSRGAKTFVHFVACVPKDALPAYANCLDLQVMQSHGQSDRPCATARWLNWVCHFTCVSEYDH